MAGPRILLAGAGGVGTALAWSGSGVLGPEALPPRPFLDLLAEYGSPWACEERTPAAP